MKIPVYVYAVWRPWDKAYEFQVFSQDMSGMDDLSSEYVLAATTEVDFDAPPNEVLQSGTVAAYRKEQQRIRADAEKKVATLERAIREMQCLEDKRETA